MRRYHKWLMTLGIAAAVPGIAHARPYTLFKPKKAPSAAQADAKAPAGKGKSTNQQVANEIAKGLRSAKLSGYKIEVQVQTGVATLSGTVATPEQRAVASRIASQTPGVQGVDNRLEVNARAEAGPQTARNLPQPPNRREPASRESIQRVQFEAAEAAGQQADPFSPGPGPGPEPAGNPNNQRMAENIARSLQAAQFSGYDIEIHYQNGVAVLDGSVASPNHRAMASSVCSQVPGVQRVENRLNVLTAAQLAALQGGVQGARYQDEAGDEAPPPPPGAVAPPDAAIPPGGPIPPGAVMPHPGMHPGMPHVHGNGQMPAVPSYGHPGSGASNVIYDQPYLPNYAWPSYASYPNYAQVTYPQQYSASAWPYIGPFYPYPQVPLGWRKAQLEWDDGYWSLNFRPRTDRWWWFLDYRNW